MSSILNFKNKRWSFIAIAWLLFVIQVHFTFKGLIMTKKDLATKSKPMQVEAKNKSKQAADGANSQPKVIMLLVDALREDFVEFNIPKQSGGQKYQKVKASAKLDNQKDHFAGQKMTILEELAFNEPTNSILLPMATDMPTVTTVKVKSIMTGTMSSFFETKEDFASDVMPEDNVIYQAKSNQKRVIFTGDHIWGNMFKGHFAEEIYYNSLNIRDLDTNDRNVHKDVLNYLERAKKNESAHFDLLVTHLLGIDHAGHTFDVKHPELQRKISETNEIIKDFVKAIDDDTILLLYGDHGMTPDGNHGGDSQNEVRTVMFAYYKKGFPMLKRSKTILKLLETYVMSDFKQIDIPSIAASMLGIPVPFSNLGIFNPLFFMEEDLFELLNVMMGNLQQIQTYIGEYCNVNHDWCDEQQSDLSLSIGMFAQNMTGIQKMKDGQEKDIAIIKLSISMRDYANEKYGTFRTIWMKYDAFACYCAIAIAFWLMIHFLLYGVADGTVKIGRAPAGAIAFFYAQILLDMNLLMGYWQASLAAIILICFFMIDVDLTNAFKNFRQQQNLLTLLCLLAWIFYQVGYDIQTSGGVPVIEGFVIWFLMLANFATRGSKFEDSSIDHKKNDDDPESESEFFQNTLSNSQANKKHSVWRQVMDYVPYVLIIVSIKMATLFDLKEMREFPYKDFFWQNETLHRAMAHLGLLGIAAIENFYINKKYKLSWTFASTIIGNLLLCVIAINNELNLKLQQTFDLKQHDVSIFGNKIEQAKVERWFVYSTWFVNATCALAVILIAVVYQCQKPDKTEGLDSKEFPKLIREEGNFKLQKKAQVARKFEKKGEGNKTEKQQEHWISEIAAIQASMFILKLVISIASVHKPFKAFIYLCMLTQIVCFHSIVESDLARLEKQQQILFQYGEKGSDYKPLRQPRIKLFTIVCFLFFTMQQYFYRTSHRENFSSLQFGKVCPGREFCDLDLEWVMIVFEGFGSQIFIFCILPMFTLKYPTQKALDMRQLEMKAIKKYKERETKQKQEEAKTQLSAAEEARRRKMQQEDEDTNLYDADMDDLDSSDIGEEEKKKLKAKKTSKFDPGLLSNIGALREAIYLFAFLSTFQFLLASLYSFWTRKELIFIEVTGPKYVFDAVQTAVFFVFVTVWV